MSAKPGIPSWQRAQAPGPTPAEKDDAQPLSEQQPDSTPTPPSGAEEAARGEDATQEAATEDATLLGQASKFLEDPAIRDAPRENKVEFLQAKGVKARDIEELLSNETPQHVSEDIAQAGERAWSSKATSKASRVPAPQSQPRDIPPIVTYPEFLAQPTEKPPLVTMKRLLNTAYMAGGLVATVYGLSKYIIGPLTQNLTESRHDFASHAQEHLDQLNERLRDAASVDAATKQKPNASDVADDISEADSDPTELYHRDFGTQTTPALSRRDSKSSHATEDESVVKAHENRLSIITSHLRELQSTRSNDTASSDSLKTQLSDLQTYLSDISYQNQYYSGSGGFYGGMYGLPKTSDGKDDQMEVLKNDIRAVKGVFLSARNFPVGGRNPAPLGRAGG
ncbi:hypothetical protein PMIN06_011080 [Paraphaeosphaeria minitans]|uniref:Peroxisomal membrane protein PEX14 n=1 Tax=Paraphaeosphaeria minitans TaxID=565426 RepID=A0A9P6GMG9_9PLEO|nr:peroxin 14/17 [Paraphaeosphaeria minitans]